MDTPDPPISDDGLPNVPSSGYTPQPGLSDEEKSMLGLPVDDVADDDSFDPGEYQSLRREWQPSDSSAVSSADDIESSAGSAGMSTGDYFSPGSLSDPLTGDAGSDVTAALSSATASIDSLTDAIKSLDVSVTDSSTSHSEAGGSPAREQPSGFQVDDADPARSDELSPSTRESATQSTSVSAAVQDEQNRPSLFDDPAWRQLRDMTAELRRAESGDSPQRVAAVQRPRSENPSGRVAPLVDNDSPLVPQQEADAAEIRRQYRRQNIRDAMYSASNVASGIAHSNGESKLGAGAGMSGVSGALSAGGSAIGMGMGPIGIGLTAAAGGAATALNAVMKSANNASASLSKYSGQMSVANANADTRQILGDVGRANTLADGVSKYTNVTSKMSEMAQNAQAAFLKAALDKIVPALESILAAIEKYGPMVLNSAIDIMEMLDGIIQSIPDIVGGITPLKVISSGMLDAAKTLRELNERDKMQNLKDAEGFLDQFLSFGGMGIDPAWKGNNPPPNKHPDANLEAKFNQLLNGGF